MDYLAKISSRCLVLDLRSLTSEEKAEIKRSFDEQRECNKAEPQWVPSPEVLADIERAINKAGSAGLISS
jgi:hypothetical protein